MEIRELFEKAGDWLLFFDYCNSVRPCRNQTLIQTLLNPGYGFGETFENVINAKLCVSTYLDGLAGEPRDAAADANNAAAAAAGLTSAADFALVWAPVLPTLLMLLFEVLRGNGILAGLYLLALESEAASSWLRFWPIRFAGDRTVACQFSGLTARAASFSRSPGLSGPRWCFERPGLPQNLWAAPWLSLELVPRDEGAGISATEVENWPVAPETEVAGLAS